MLCGKCKREIPDGSAFCPYCSAPADAPASSPFKQAGDLGPVSAGAPGPADPPVDPAAPPRAAALFCQNCGAALKEGAKFCASCGAKVESDEAQPAYTVAPGIVDPPQPDSGYTDTPPTRPASGYDVPPRPASGYDVPPRPASGYVYTPPMPARPASGIGATPARNALWALCTSPLALVAIITYSLSILFSVFSAISGPSGALGQFASYLSYLPSDVYAIIRRVYTSTMLIALVPAILIAVGLWLTYVTAAQRGVKTAGLTIIKVIVIIQLVCLCIGLAAGLIVLVIALAVTSDFEYAVGVIIVGIAVLAAIAVLSILYYAKVIQTINTIRITFLSGNPSDKVSAYVAVLTFISAAVSVISAITAGSVLLTLSGLCTAAASIAFGIFIFSYRTKMRLL